MTEVLIPKTCKTQRHETDLQNLVTAVTLSCKAISRLLRDGPSSRTNPHLLTNATGDTQHAIDIVSNDILLENIKATESYSVIVSEENESPILADENSAGPYCIAFDPLDGSSNIDCNIPTGTIFAIWERQESMAEISEKDILRPAKDIVCCGYCVYSAATELIVVFDGTEPARYILDQVHDNFRFVSHLQIPVKSKKICSVNQGNTHCWNNTTKWIVNTFNSNGYSSRYVGSLVADIHRTLLYGGIYMYPSIAKPKLRLLYEVAPITKIISEAGGAALSGVGLNICDLLERIPQSIHEKTAIVCGCHRDIDIYRNMNTFSELMTKQNFKIEGIE